MLSFILLTVMVKDALSVKTPSDTITIQVQDIADPVASTSISVARLIKPVVGAIEKYPTFDAHVMENLCVSPLSSS